MGTLYVFPNGGVSPLGYICGWGDKSPISFLCHGSTVDTISSRRATSSEELSVCLHSDVSVLVLHVAAYHPLLVSCDIGHRRGACHCGVCCADAVFMCYEVDCGETYLAVGGDVLSTPLLLVKSILWILSVL